jgi:hypothetical protein
MEILVRSNASQLQHTSANTLSGTEALATPAKPQDPRVNRGSISRGSQAVREVREGHDI